MKHITLLVLHDAVLPSIVDPSTLFTGSNDFLQSLGREPLFNLQLAGLNREVQLNNGKFTVHTDVLINEIKKTDLILIPAIGGDLKKTLENNRDFIPWIIKQYQSGAEVASLCIGSF